MEITRLEVEEYLNRVKEAVKNDNYRIEMNKNRSDNRNLFVDYVLNEVRIKEILLSLTVHDFPESRKNNHKGFENEILYFWERNKSIGEIWCRLQGSQIIYKTKFDC